MVSTLRAIASVAALFFLGCSSALSNATDAPRHDTARVGDIEQHYRTIGSGPPLLLLHGLTNTWRVWRPYLDLLSTSHTLIVPDIRGHGDTGAGSVALTPNQVAQDTWAMLDALNVTQVQVVGYSFGAHVALRMAARQPERVSAMILVAGAHRLLGSSRALHEASLKTPIPDGWWLNEVATWHPGGKAQVHGLLSQGLDAVLAPEFDMSDAELAAIRARTLIVQGDRDDFFPLEVPLDLHRRLRDAQLWIIPNTTHSSVFWTDVAPAGTDFGGGRSAAQVFPAIAAAFLGR